MPKDQAAIERRIFESWRARACAAGLCVGAQIFLFGTGIVMPMALNSTWLCAVISLPFPVFITIASRKKSIMYDSPVSCAALIMLTITLLANAVFASAALISFAEQTLLEQARVLWIALLTVIAIFLCALSGGSGVSWLCFALRWSLPVLIGGLILSSVPMKVPSGLFPLLGPGSASLGVGALCMLGASSPALMLLLPPPELEQKKAEESLASVPKIGFFVRRVLAGAAAGVLILLCACICTTYEAIEESMEWGMRLRIVASDQPHEGIPQVLLILLQMTAILLLCANMLSAAEQAFIYVMKKTGRSYIGLMLLSLLMILLLWLVTAYGFDLVLFAAPFLFVPALLILAMCRKKGATPR